jgi:glucose-6-phosphate 1-dehydrogenase
MTSRFIAVDPFDLVVFGGAGDLAYRKLLPALFHRHCDNQIPSSARIIGVSRRQMSDEDYRAATEKALYEHVDRADGEAVQTFLRCLHFVSVDAQSDDGWDDLRTMLTPHNDRVRAFYLAVGPELFGTICSQIGNHGLATPEARIVIEKPIGHDLESAMAVKTAPIGTSPCSSAARASSSASAISRSAS